MDLISKNYQYNKIVGGEGRYGEVEIEVDFTVSATRVVDECEWKTFKKSYPNFKELDILKAWKLSAIEASNSIIKNYVLPKPIKLTIKDIVGMYVDTQPSHIGAAIIIGIFDLCNSPLRQKDIEILDEFVSNNRGVQLIPNYDELILTKPHKNQ